MSDPPENQPLIGFGFGSKCVTSWNVCHRSDGSEIEGKKRLETVFFFNHCNYITAATSWEARWRIIDTLILAGKRTMRYEGMVNFPPYNFKWFLFCRKKAYFDQLPTWTGSWSLFCGSHFTGNESPVAHVENFFFFLKQDTPNYYLSIIWVAIHKKKKVSNQKVKTQFQHFYLQLFGLHFTSNVFHGLIIQVKIQTFNYHPALPWLKHQKPRGYIQQWFCITSWAKPMMCSIQWRRLFWLLLAFWLEVFPMMFCSWTLPSKVIQPVLIKVSVNANTNTLDINTWRITLKCSTVC